MICKGTNESKHQGIDFSKFKFSRLKSLKFYFTIRYADRNYRYCLNMVNISSRKKNWNYFIVLYFCLTVHSIFHGLIKTGVPIENVYVFMQVGCYLDWIRNNNWKCVVCKFQKMDTKLLSMVLKSAIKMAKPSRTRL